jgi:hypothetical protein
MKIANWLKDKSWWFKTGLLLVFLHLLFLIWIISIIYSGDAQWQLAWWLPEHVDFPISLLFRYVILPITPSIEIDVSFLLPEHFGDFYGFISPFVFFLVVGTGWYFYLPVLLRKASKKIAVSQTSRAVVVLLMVTPVLVSWAELFRFQSYQNDLYYLWYITDWAFYLLPTLWILLFIWLYFVSSRKKTILWLLCLLPLVFFYLSQELYVFIKFTVPRMGG